MALPSFSSRAVLPAVLLAKTEVAPRHFHFLLQAPFIASKAKPGQFVHVLPRTADSFDPLLRRAFSLMNVDSALGTIELLFRAGGRGTQLLSDFVEGEILDLLGPLGQPFDVSPFHVKQDGVEAPRAVLVGGGVGVPPLVFLGKQLASQGIVVSALVGARSASETLGEANFETMQVPFQLATDDGSRGHHGRVTNLLEPELDASPHSVVYACGPWPMLRAVAALCDRFGALCQVSLEENMPCGIGVCNGCVVRAREPLASNGTASCHVMTPARVVDDWSEYERYRRVCIEGPACWAHEIDWS